MVTKDFLAKISWNYGHIELTSELGEPYMGMHQKVMTELHQACLQNFKSDLSGPVKQSDIFV